MARILIIDDEPAIALALQEILNDEGYSTDVASTGLSGLEHLENGVKPDLILLDLFLPGMSGRDIVLYMRQCPRLTQIPAILITGAVPNPHDFPPEDSYQGFLAKPFDVMDVVEKVNSILHDLCHVS